ncbi:MAG: glycosyltransferase [Candidatus Jordarchaeum sp.]|uniref:glycosyltransferase n=1 Tax=Candidatus Jordarchaeum sp. TaxID=2823881 RepID=UPI00404B0A69
MPTVSFILPTKNVEKNIRNLLESIFSQDVEYKKEVLIMDSSNDKTPEIVKKYPVKLVRVEPEDYNYGGTRNLGATMTTGEFLVFLSTDVEIKDKKWLSKLLRNFSDPKVGGVFGRQIPKENATPMEKFFILNTYPTKSYTLSLSNSQKLKKAILFSNTNSAIRRSVWKKVKLPEMLKSEDQEWAKRALTAGHKIVYDSEAIVYHSHNYTIKNVFQEYFDSGATMPYVYDKKVINYSMNNFLLDGIKYTIREYNFMASNGYLSWIPYVTIYDAFKFLGMFLGSKHKYMPLWLKKALCKKKNHWDKYDGIINE